MIVIRTLSSYLPNDIENLVLALLLVVSLGIYGFLLFAAPIFIGIKHGALWGAATLGLCIAWIFLFTFLILIFFLVTHAISTFSPIYPMMRASSGISLPQTVGNIVQ